MQYFRFVGNIVLFCFATIQIFIPSGCTYLHIVWKLITSEDYFLHSNANFTHEHPYYLLFASKWLLQQNEKMHMTGVTTLS